MPEFQRVLSKPHLTFQADLNLGGLLGHSPLLLAVVHSDDREKAKRDRAQGPELEPEPELEPARLRSSWSLAGLIRQLIAAKVDVNRPFQHKGCSIQRDATPIYCAVSLRHASNAKVVSQLLINARGDVERTCRGGIRPLSIAINKHCGDPSFLALLVNAKAEINTPLDGESIPPLTKAIRSHLFTLAKAMLPLKAAVNGDPDSPPPLMEAIWSGSVPMLCALLEAGANPKALRMQRPPDRMRTAHGETFMRKTAKKQAPTGLRINTSTLPAPGEQGLGLIPSPHIPSPNIPSPAELGSSSPGSNPSRNPSGGDSAVVKAPGLAIDDLVVMGSATLGRRAQESHMLQILTLTLTLTLILTLIGAGVPHAANKEMVETGPSGPRFDAPR